MNTKKAFLFPGQGAQFVGMGKDIYEVYPEAKEVYESASKISGVDIKKLCFEGPEEELNKTENTQLAILATSLATLAVVEKHGIKPDIAVGLSLGEYSALVCSGVLDFETAIKLVQKRGYYMGNLLPKEKFEMAAVIGLESKKIEQICEEIKKQGKFIVAANYNCSMQTAISGESEAIKEASEALKQADAKRVIPLKTSGPFHTEKLEEAKKAYSKELEKVEFYEGKIPVIKNLDGTIYNKEDNMKEILAKHIVSPVRFDKAIELMKEQKIEQYVEIGPGKVLTGFVKKEDKEAKTVNLNSFESVKEYLEEE